MKNLGEDCTTQMNTGWKSALFHANNLVDWDIHANIVNTKAQISANVDFQNQVVPNKVTKMRLVTDTDTTAP